MPKVIMDILTSKGVVYLLDDFVGAVFKVLGNKTMVKFKGEKAYEVGTEQPIVYDAMIGGKVITEKEFEAY